MIAKGPNMLLEEVKYKVEKDRSGIRRSYLYPTGQLFTEYTSHARLFGLPLVHTTSGVCPETGRRIVAKGVYARGRVAFGVIAVGQAAIGFIVVGQLAVGLLFGLGQASSGLFAVGQFALAGLLGVGQFATGLVAIGQLALGVFVLAQSGYGMFVFDMRGASPAMHDLLQRLPWR